MYLKEIRKNLRFLHCELHVSHKFYYFIQHWWITPDPQPLIISESQSIQDDKQGNQTKLSPAALSILVI